MAVRALYCERKSIDAKTVGDTEVFPAVTGRRWMISDAHVGITKTGTPGTAPVASLGGVGADYDDIIDMTDMALFAANGEEKRWVRSTGNALISAAGAAVVCRISTAATTYDVFSLDLRVSAMLL